MATVDIWPLGILTPQNIARRYLPMSVAGGAAVSGWTQTVVSPSARWAIGYENIICLTNKQIRLRDALEVILEGRATPIIVPLCEGNRRPLVSDNPPSSEVPHSDETYFDDDTGYVGSPIYVDVDTDAALRATTLSLTVTSAGTLQPGQHFSIGERLYRIQRLISSAGDPTGSPAVPMTYVVTIRPGLRELVVAGTPANFTDPVCKCRLASDNEMGFTLEMLKRGTFSVNFIEDPY